MNIRWHFRNIRIYFAYNMLVKLNQSRNIASDLRPGGLNEGVVYPEIYKKGVRESVASNITTQTGCSERLIMWALAV